VKFLRIVLFCGLVLIFSYFTEVVGAHGGGTPQLTNAIAGPYWVSVWTQPNPLQVGVVHFTVAVSEAPVSGAVQGEAGPPVLGATVELRLESENSPSPTLVVQATHESAVNKLFYEADLELSAADYWHVTVMAEGPAGSGSADFDIEVIPARSNRLWLVGGFGVILLLAGWAVQRWFWKRQING